VIRLLASVANHSKSPRFNRHNIWLRDKGRCQYCGGKCPLDGEGKFTYDHVIPASQGGVRKWENVVVACYGCNQKKGGRTPEQAGMRLMSRPVRPRSLPGAAGGRRGVAWSSGMPDGWRQWLRDTLYWHDELQ
jgi:5-methylcytosine-specific restriction endonuclease McrA